jgi:glycosyltransferase involved in cell wall biosynthesis
MTDPLVSIITPTFNHERFIADCIDSVRQQTYPNWEMIIINDGSTDKTAEIIGSIIKDEPKIKLLQQQNIGVFRLSETYNKALGAARGAYIAILEGDDFWEPDKLERQVAALESRPECVLAWGRAFVVNQDRSRKLRELPLGEAKFKKHYTNSPVPGFLNILFYVNCIPAMTLLIRREALVRVGGFLQSHQLPLVDIPTLMELSLLGEFYYDDHPLGSWRHYIGQTTKTYLADSLQKAETLSLNYYDKLDPKIKKRLFVTKGSIEKYFHSAIHIAYARMGRYKLIQKDRAGARRDYLTAIWYRGALNPLWRLRAIVGYLFSFVGWDVEGLARFLGRPSYKP